MLILLESTTVTAIGIVAALVGIAASAVAIYLFFRQRQFGRPKLQLLFGWGPPPDNIPRKIRKLPVSVFVIAPNVELRKPLVTFLFFVLHNPGRESIRNVRVSFEYDESFLIKNELFKSLATFEPGIIPELSDSKQVAVITSGLPQAQVDAIIKDREVVVFDGRAQVSMNIEIVRPGESWVVYDVLLLPGSGPHDIQNLGFGRGGFRHIVDLMRRNKELLDHLVVNTLVFAENHEKLNSKISVFRFPSEKQIEDGLQAFRNALWLDRLPQPGLYFSEPISRWLRNKRARTGRRGPEMFRDELGLIRHSVVAEITADGKQFSTELPEKSPNEYFAFSSPNYDYFELPAEVDTPERLMEWLGSSKQPLLTATKGTTNGGARTDG